MPLKSIWHAGRFLTTGWVIRNYREYCRVKPHRRALLSYIVQPLLPPARFRDRVLFSPFGIAQEIPRALNEMGYSVDIVNFNNKRWQPRGSYDLFIGHGALNFERLAAALPRDTKKIYFATGLYWKEGNRREAERLYDLAMRTGWLLPPERCVSLDEDRANSLADGIVQLGNARAGETYAAFGNPHGINNASYPAAWDGWRTKDYAAGSQHFLFYEGPGNVHKGLDRILEAFAALPLHLHVCQHIQPPFGRVYRRLLSGAPNIHVYQFIRQRSAQFYDLARRCNWALSATCGEGQPGSIVEMMAHGLIPILPETANIDLGAWGIPLPGCSALQIAETCSAASAIPAAECQSMAGQVIEETRARYSVEHFRRSFQNAVRNIAEGAPTQAPARPAAAIRS